jgi:MFS family permease
MPAFVTSSVTNGEGSFLLRCFVRRYDCRTSHRSEFSGVRALSAAVVSAKTPLSRQQVLGFWAAWGGWTLDGMDSFIYALVLAPALTELLPKSGYEATPASIASIGSILFALFLVGWGFSFIWGPIADRIGRTRTLALTIFVFAIFTGLAALSQNVWELAIFRLLAGIGIGGEWAMAGTYIAEAWPEGRRKAGAGYLQTGYYAGFFLAAALNVTIGVHYGWRAMFATGLIPVVLAIVTLLRVEEPKRWSSTLTVKHQRTLTEIFSPMLRTRTLVNAGLLTVAIAGLWAGAVYEPTAILQLAKIAGYAKSDAVKFASLGTAILSIGTILGCLFAPILAERIGRRGALGAYFAGMGVMIVLCFGIIFYLPNALAPFIVSLFFLGFAGGNFALFSLWLPEQYETAVRATAFAFCTSVGRFIGAAINFGIAGLVRSMGTLGTPVALTAVAFAFGLILLRFSVETRGSELPP